MRHLIVCREYPPAPYAPGGIGTYAAHMSRALAERGKTVHVIGQRWKGAPNRVERLCDGRLIVHRIAPEDEDLYPSLAGTPEAARAEMAALLATRLEFPWFSWVAAGLTEKLVVEEGVDVIEAQEWEAPLYHFMLRRALGLGPERTPPCVVHLHSPTELIFRYNEWSRGRPDYLRMKRMEDYVILAADALLCPSHYLASQCEQHYGLAPGSIRIIRYPRGETPMLERDEEAWAKGPICYFGRLEPRKGVIEWVDAAVTVAREDPDPVFEFIGADLPFTEAVSVRQLAQSRIPPELRPRFVFHDSQPREALLARLSRARMAAVPSRWENFPNTCIEAMGTGLPVIAAPHGGMAEMVEDGVSGWIAPNSDDPMADRLADALRRALATPVDEVRRMGEAAARSIRAMCDNTAIVGHHLEFRGALRDKGAERSLALPPGAPWLERAGRPKPARKAGVTADGGVGVVLPALRGAAVADALAALADQTLTPRTIVVVGEPEQAPTGADCRLVPYTGASQVTAKRLALQSAAGDEPLAWLFLDPGDRLHPWALERLIDVLRHRPDVGIVGAWCEGPHGVAGTAPSVLPGFPYQWLWDELQGPTLYRAEAVREVGGLRAEIEDDLEEWDLATAVMAAGWAAVRLPVLIGASPASAPGPHVPLSRSRVRAHVLERFPDLLGLDAAALVTLLESREAAQVYFPRLRTVLLHRLPSPVRPHVQRAVRLIKRGRKLLAGR